MGIHTHSEISKAKKILLHRPGNELLNLTPNHLKDLLFDDIPYLKKAQEEHDAFSAILRKEGVETVYLEDLMTEVLDLHPELVKPFLYQWFKEANIYTYQWQDTLYHYLTNNYKGKALVEKTMEGVTFREMKEDNPLSLQDRIAPPDDLVIGPMPNLYFQRDPFAPVGDGVILNKMHYETRRRETIYASYIFQYHPEYKNVKRYYERDFHASIEGGDIFNLSEDTVCIGISERTTADAIEIVAKNIFEDPDSLIRRVIAMSIPATRAFMHLDTVFTRIDTDKFLVHPGIIESLKIFEITPGEKYNQIREFDKPLKEVLEEVTGVDHIELIYCGGGDAIVAAREQWNDGANALCIAPGKIVVYDRNDVTNQILLEKGIELLQIPSSELSRGRGGTRCMSCVLERK